MDAGRKICEIDAFCPPQTKHLAKKWDPVFRDQRCGFKNLKLQPSGVAFSMSQNAVTPTIKVLPKTQRPRLHKVILVNDDFTPRDFVVTVLKAEFRMNESQAHRVMVTAHMRGVCVVAVFARDIAETKATRATEAGRAKGYPLLFTTEPEE
jgi:ATP-dependent Clp protease adaptor protein ClpS